MMYLAEGFLSCAAAYVFCCSQTLINNFHPQVQTVSLPVFCAAVAQRWKVMCFYVISNDPPPWPMSVSDAEEWVSWEWKSEKANRMCVSIHSRTSRLCPGLYGRGSVGGFSCAAAGIHKSKPASTVKLNFNRKKKLFLPKRRVNS